MKCFYYSKSPFSKSSSLKRSEPSPVTADETVHK